MAKALIEQRRPWMVAYAHAAIQAVQHNEKPVFFYGATTLFMQIINRNTLGDRKYQTLIDFEMAHGPIAQENMMWKAGQVAAAMGPTEEPASPDAPPSGTAVPNAATQVRQVAANLP
jgi:hypothetical protein